MAAPIIKVGTLGLIPQPMRTLVEQALERRDREIAELKEKLAAAEREIERNEDCY